MHAVLFSCLAIVSTFVGGIFTLRYKDRLHRILGFTAGVILGVVAFDILPELFEQIHKHDINTAIPMAALVGGFLLFHIIEKNILLHTAHEGEFHGHSHPQLGMFSALVLIGHSFLDGVGIGLAFQVNSTVGITVALAVIAHDFADGMNTVGLMLRHGNRANRARIFLMADALAPLLGTIIATRFTIGPAALSVYLGLFCGVLLYLCASDILPEAHAKHPSRLTMALTVAGVLLIFLVTRAL